MAELARSQMGLVSRDQLRHLGVSDRAITRALESGRLHRVFHSIYSVGHAGVGPHARLRAATMACGAGTVVSHSTAAWLLGIRDWQPLDVDVIAPVESGRRIAGVKRRFVPAPASWEVGVWKGVPTTGVARTIVDCAGILQVGELGDLIESAAVRGALRVEAIDRILDGPPRLNGKRLLRLLEPWRRYRPGIRLRSRMEAKLLPLLTEGALPIPETNAKIRVGRKTYEVDFLWRRQRLVVETDGGRFHDNPQAGSRDSGRNRALMDVGFLVSRLGWEDLRDRPEATMSELARLLRERS